MLVSLVRCYFYTTEKQKDYQKIFYYRKNIWNFVMALAVQDLQTQNLRPVPKTEVKNQCDNNNFAPAKLRLVPKGETVRPIMTFNRKVPHNKTQTTNRKLGNAHLLLKDLKTNMLKQQVGFPVVNYDDIVKKYEPFV